MNGFPLVAVSQRVDSHIDRNEQRDALDQRLVRFLVVAGFLPVPVPNCLVLENGELQKDRNALDIWLEELNPQAVLLSGGNDIGSCKERDLTELRILNFARSWALPTLGLCRGMQQIGVWAEGVLGPVEGHVGTRHVLEIVDGFGDFPVEVNSYHDLTVSKCPKGFDVVARSEDGGIEAVRHREYLCEGWMWHPERETEFSPIDLRRIRMLFSGGDSR